MEPKLLFQLILQCITRWNFGDLKSRDELLEAPRNRPADRQLKISAEVCMVSASCRIADKSLNVYPLSSHSLKSEV